MLRLGNPGLGYPVYWEILLCENPLNSSFQSNQYTVHLQTLMESQRRSQGGAVLTRVLTHKCSSWTSTHLLSRSYHKKVPVTFHVAFCTLKVLKAIWKATMPNCTSSYKNSILSHQCVWWWWWWWWCGETLRNVNALGIFYSFLAW